MRYVERGGPPGTVSWWVSIALVLVALATIGVLGEAEREPHPAGQPAGRHGQHHGRRARSSELPQSEGSTAVVLYTADEDLLTEEALDDPATSGTPGRATRRASSSATTAPRPSPSSRSPMRAPRPSADAVAKIRAESADATSPSRRHLPGDRAGRHPGRPRRGLRRRQPAPAAGHGQRGRPAPADHLPQPDPLAGAAGRGRPSPTGWPPSWPPTPCATFSTSPGTSPRWGSCRSWCSAPAPTTHCC